jgi:LacI family transcriptional regulator/LacI family repressor for deo operon, udp, cdd, tsx, nupC, and nupG
VAEEAGVSVATVSRVLNHQSGVTERKRKRVLRTVERMGYARNRIARRLRGLKSQVIGLVIPDIQNPFFTAIARGIEDRLAELGFSLLLCNSDDNRDKERTYLDILRAESVAGVILTTADGHSAAVDALVRAGIPVVAIDRRIDSTRVDSVLVDNMAGAFQAVSHLIELGHRHIGFIGLPLYLTPGRERHAGYQKALRDHGLTAPAAYRRITGARLFGGKEATQQLLDAHTRITALFVANNMMTLGAMDAIRQRGWRIPQDISLVGFDDAPWYALVEPPITCVAQPTYELGLAAARLLLEHIEQPDLSAQHLRLPPRLIVRSSCAPLAPGTARASAHSNGR